MRIRVLTWVAVLMVMLCRDASAVPPRLTVLDYTGAAFPNVLVIVKSLAGKGEIFRALTDDRGSVPERGLPAGLYRANATCPYGLCKTKVSEFLVGDSRVMLELKVDVTPTQGNFAVVGPSSQLTIQVVDVQGRPAASAQALVRDSAAEFEQWYTTNAQGEADVEPRVSDT
jgi:hypothetical protein